MKDRYGRVVYLDEWVSSPRDPLYKITRDMLIDWADENYEMLDFSIHVDHWGVGDGRLFPLDKPLENLEVPIKTSIAIKLSGYPKTK